MPLSGHLGLPLIEAGQAQKHVTHNEALRILDALVQLSIVDVLSAPPGAPDEGARYIVGAGASGVFASHEDDIAAFEDGAWRFLAPQPGWRAWDEADEVLLLWNGSAWSALEGGAGGFDPDDVSHLYLNDAAPEDANVKLAMRGEAALLHAIPAGESGSGDVQLQISKETASDTASVFFATNFSGRAEFGLTGSDNFTLKVSADGTTWLEALDIDKTTGRVRLPAAVALTDADQVVAWRDIRERLTAARTYYVRSDGNDANSGLVNDSGGAFLTIQAAVNAAASVDTSIYDVTVEIGSGSYASFDLKPMTGAGMLHITGDTAVPSNVLISTSSAGDHCIDTSGVNGKFRIRGLKLAASGSGAYAINAAGGAGLYLEYGNLDFGAVASGYHVFAIGGANINVMAPIAISGGASNHILVANTAFVRSYGVAYTLSGTPSFGAFCAANALGGAYFGAASFSGSASGARYSAALNGIINTDGGGASFLPGNAAGSASSGGQYA